MSAYMGLGTVLGEVIGDLEMPALKINIDVHMSKRNG